MMKAALFGTVAMAADSKTSFLAFMKQHGRQYEASELNQRFEIFKANLAKIEAHNAAGETWTMGITQFSDMTEEEFSASMGYNHREKSFARSQNLHVAPKNQVIADSLDWVTKGAVTPVKNQGQCGSCWAFSTVGGMEGAVQIATGKLTSLAEQQLVDCAGAEGNQGCNGGLMDDGFEYIIKNGGLGSEESYTYTATDGTCKTVPSVSTISGYKDVAAKDEAGLLSALNMQPVSIAVDAASNWQQYSGGIVSGFKCSGQSLDHGVLLVGYGTDSGTDYWKIKNSWGASWGEEGYLRAQRNKDCFGLANAASYPTV